ncbi:capsule assembly Wzi family protein [Ferrimonas balearica]|uniref:capsule assembly Wzi family protein n=1 Tax=Ferrimonas balearica TaxID=44012 RepID=UPI001C99182D|nr:capsule assembly Wzi family protein [Ferrimonas balearica]MBY5994081.1 capsule assembly Wzi family protein [Ferrimonas balearica]
MKKLLSAVLLSSAVAPAAWGASAYVSLQDGYLNGRIDQLVVVTNMPTMRKPYNVKQVRQHLELIKDEIPGLYHEIDRGLYRYERELSVTYAEVGVAAADTPSQGHIMPNARGERIDSNYRVTATAQYRPTDWMILSVGGLALDSAGGRYDDESGSDAIPVGTYASFGWDSFQVDVGYREHWLSPFAESAVLMSTNARPSFSIGVSNPIPFEGLWNLQYEVYVARLEWTDQIVYGDELESGRPALLGFQTSFSPVEGWTIALNRTMQFGGGSREVTLRSIWDAFWDPAGNDNSSKVECDGPPNTCESGNQQASISSRMNFGGPVPFAILMEFAGEDTGSHSNYQLSNIATSFGVHIPFLPDWLGGPDWSLQYEMTEWQHAWYTHYIYKNGYTNDGIVMGHWGANNRVFNDSARGAQNHALKLGWQRDTRQRYELTYRLTDNKPSDAYDYSVGHELDLRYFGQLFGQQLGYRLYGGRNVFSEGYFRGELIWQW